MKSIATPLILATACITAQAEIINLACKSPEMIVNLTIDTNRSVLITGSKNVTPLTITDDAFTWKDNVESDIFIGMIVRATGEFFYYAEKSTVTSASRLNCEKKIGNKF